MKLVLIGFDLATFWLVIKILGACKLQVELSVAYAWCPLLLKEVANSGHLDAIAIFLTTATIYFLIRLLRNSGERSTFRPSGQRFDLAITTVALSFALSFVLSLAVGAKLYPVVLCPLVFFVLLRRVGFVYSSFALAVFVATTSIILWPMFGMTNSETPSAVNASLIESADQGNVSVVADPSQGIKTFLKYWEMNDFLFMVVVENLKPASDFPANQAVWFSILPDGTRELASDFTVARMNTKYFPISKREAPFILTRLITTTLFLFIALGLAWRVAAVPTAQRVCQSTFLTLAWLWLLIPTQNPWYWLWALPLLPVMRNRAWFAVSGLVMVYYLRFWLGYHFTQTTVLGTQLTGTMFFDFVVTWLEFGPWFGWLTVSWLVSRRNRSESST